MKRDSKLVFVCALVLIAIIVLPNFSPMGRSRLKRNVPSISTPPIIQGWGGVTLDEASNGQLQQTLQRLNQSGYNGVRIGFSAGVTGCSSGELGSWDPNWFRTVVTDATQYSIWIIADYHSYLDLINSACQTQWLSFWSGVLSTNWGYDRIVWEPINEPAGSASVLSAAYQLWITQARTLGDKHWIAVENTISNNGCSFDPLSLVGCYPVVTDPLNETFLSIHPYLFYDLWLGGTTYGACNPSVSNVWGNATAECVADIYNQGMLQASSTYHMPILDTEGGAVYYSCNSVCASPPDAVGTDDASYSMTTFHFMQYLTTLMQSENLGWIWWEAGEGNCCGALDTWGSLLNFQPAKPPGPDTPPLIDAPSGESVIAGSTLSFKVNASDPDNPPQNLALSCSNCPAGSGFPAASGLGRVTGSFSWIPTASQVGQYNLTFTVSDLDEGSIVRVLLSVLSNIGPPRNIPPVLVIPGNRTVSVGSTISFGVNATDSNTPPEMIVLSCLDCTSLGAGFSQVTGTILVEGNFNWGPSHVRVPGTYTLDFIAFDGVNSTAASVQVTVVKASTMLAASVYPRTLTIGHTPVSVSDTATLVGGFDPTGSITFQVFPSGASCTGNSVFTSVVQVNGDAFYSSQPFNPQVAGTYQWRTVYSGDVNNSPFETRCGLTSETMTVSSVPGSQGPPPTCQSCPLFSSLWWIGGVLAVVSVVTLFVWRKRVRMKT